MQSLTKEQIKEIEEIIKNTFENDFKTYLEKFVKESEIKLRELSLL